MQQNNVQKGCEVGTYVIYYYAVGCDIAQQERHQNQQCLMLNVLR